MAKKAIDTTQKMVEMEIRIPLFFTKLPKIHLSEEERNTFYNNDVIDINIMKENLINKLDSIQKTMPVLESSYLKKSVKDYIESVEKSNENPELLNTDEYKIQPKWLNLSLSDINIVIDRILVDSKLDLNEFLNKEYLDENKNKIPDNLKIDMIYNKVINDFITNNALHYGNSLLQEHKEFINTRLFKIIDIFKKYEIGSSFDKITDEHKNNLYSLCAISFLDTTIHMDTMKELYNNFKYCDYYAIYKLIVNEKDTNKLYSLITECIDESLNYAIGCCLIEQHSNDPDSKKNPVVTKVLEKMSKEYLATNIFNSKLTEIMFNITYNNQDYNFFLHYDLNYKDQK